MIPIYNMKHQSKDVETQLGKVLLSLGVTEGWLDSKFRPILVENFRYDSAIMKGVQYVANEGGCAWKDTKEHNTTPDPNQATLDIYMHDHPHETEARLVADILGYESVANCAAMWREAIGQGLLTASERGGTGWLMCSGYGHEQLQRWEALDDA